MIKMHQIHIWIIIFLKTIDRFGDKLRLNLNFIFTKIVDQYPSSCESECRCYVNVHQRALVADCAHADLTQIPKSLPKDTDWLDLRNNNITHIPEDFVRYFTDSKLMQLRLSANRFGCNCGNVWMKDSFFQNREKIKDYDTVDCEMESGKRVKFMKLKTADLMCEPGISMWKILGLKLMCLIFSAIQKVSQ